MKDQNLIRELAEIRAMQATTLHLLRVVIESALSGFGKEGVDVKANIQALLTRLVIDYEDRLREWEGLEPLPYSTEREQLSQILDWPDVLSNIGNDPAGDD